MQTAQYEGAAEEAKVVRDDVPDVEDVYAEYRKCVNDFDSYTTMLNRNYDARHCRWPGQSADQRKRSRVTNGVAKKPFPWDGASDLKVAVVDELIADAVATDLVGLSGANIRAQPVGMDNLGKATLATHFMRWLLDGEMREKDDEAELVSQTRHEGGVGVMKVFWSQKVQRVAREVTMDELAAQYPMLGEAMAAGTLDDEIAAMLVQVFGTEDMPVKKARAKAMVTELREKGKAVIPAKQSVEARPKIKALTPGVDVFFPLNTACLQDASAIYERVWMSPAQSRERVHTDGWDEDYVEYVATRCTGEVEGDTINSEYRYDTARMGYAGADDNTRQGMIEWIYAYRKRSDENGVPGVYVTIFCPGASKGGEEPVAGEGYAKQELLGYRHGCYPFVAFARERISRCLLDSRGIPEMAAGWQNAIKVEMDSRIDTASLATCPPRFHPTGREPADWGPGVSVPTRAGRADYGFLEGPPFPNHSIEVQAALMKMTRQHFGRVTDALDAAEAAKKTQKQVNRFLWPWREVMEMIWALYQQYGPEEEFFRVVGATSEQAMQYKKADFQSKYSFWFSFDVLDLDPERIMLGLEKLGPIMAQWDAGGQLNKEEVLRMFVARVFGPVAADRLILPKETAVDKEVKETQNDIAKMAAGVDIDPPMNSATQVRQQVIQQWQQGSQDNPATDVQQRLATDEALKKRIEKYTKQLQFQEQQRQNAQIGRQGAAPAYS